MTSVETVGVEPSDGGGVGSGVGGGVGLGVGSGVTVTTTAALVGSSVVGSSVVGSSVVGSGDGSGKVNSIISGGESHEDVQMEGAPVDGQGDVSTYLYDRNKIGGE